MMRLLCVLFMVMLPSCYSPREGKDDTSTTTSSTTVGDADTDADSDSDTDTDVDTDTVTTSTGDSGSTGTTGMTTETGTTGTVQSGDTGTAGTADTGTPACVPTLEVCDGVDQDCDGVADNGLDVTLHEDADGDGFGVFAGQVFACDADTSGFVVDATDCNDADAGVYLGAEEIPGDGIDQDCTGGDLKCGPGESSPVFTYISEPGATNVVVSTEMNNLGMSAISEGSPIGWHVTSNTDPVTSVATVMVWSDSCAPDTTLWQATASFSGAPGGWDCVGALASFYGSWQVHDEDGVLQSTAYVLNGLGGCEMEVQ